MKRPALTISGRAVSPSELRNEVKEASLAWLRDNREAKATKKRRHRALSEADREAKAQATAAAKKKRADERDARELDNAPSSYEREDLAPGSYSSMRLPGLRRRPYRTHR